MKSQNQARVSVERTDKTVYGPASSGALQARLGEISSPPQGYAVEIQYPAPQVEIPNETRYIEEKKTKAKQTRGKQTRKPNQIKPENQTKTNETKRANTKVENWQRQRKLPKEKRKEKKGGTGER